MYIKKILLAILVWNWEPMGGVVWSIDPSSWAYDALYVLFFTGWIVLFTSSFLINHFDLFGLRQTFLELKGESYTPLKFRVKSFYKFIRHPLYLGGIVGLWAAPYMTVTHLVFAILLTSYFVIGALFEEQDLMEDFGEMYKGYMRETPMFIPFFKWTKSA